MSSEHPKQEFRVRIEGPLDEKARGSGTLDDGRLVRLPGVLPGEEIIAVAQHVQKDGTINGWLGSVVDPSSHRVSVECTHFLQCGGCDFLHADMELQHAFKRARVADALGLAENEVDPVVSSPDPLGARAMAKFVVTKNGTLGSYRPWTHSVVDMSGCVAHHPILESIADRIRQVLKTHPPTGLRYVMIRVSVKEERALVMFVTQQMDPPVLNPVLSELKPMQEVAKIAVHLNLAEGDALVGPGPVRVVYDEGPLLEDIGGVQQVLDVGAFSQVNPRAAALLYGWVVEQMSPKDKRVVDLYGGSGGIGLCLARAGASEVLLVEAHAGAAQAAGTSAKHNGLESILKIRAESAEDAAEGMAPGDLDALVLNPPRKGASRTVLEAIHRLAPACVVYVSCNPDSLARDLDILKTLGGVKIERVSPFDLFPQTKHVETAVTLSFGARP